MTDDNYLTEMCSGSKAGSNSRLIDFVYHSTLGLRVIKKKKKKCRPRYETSAGTLCQLDAEGTTRAEDAQVTPTQSHISPSILAYEEKLN